MKIKGSESGDKSEQLGGLDDSPLHCEKAGNENVENTCAYQQAVTEDGRSVNNQCQGVIR